MSDVAMGQTILCANRAATSLTALSTLLDALCKHVIDLPVTSNRLYSIFVHLPIGSPELMRASYHEECQYSEIVC
jgi:hypothetical protein